MHFTQVRIDCCLWLLLMFLSESMSLLTLSVACIVSLVLLFLVLPQSAWPCHASGKQLLPLKLPGMHPSPRKWTTAPGRYEVFPRPARSPNTVRCYPGNGLVYFGCCCQAFPAFIFLHFLSPPTIIR